MASLDAFLVRAARLPRIAARSPQDHRAAAGELLQQAVELLPQYPQRSTEIAMAASRLGVFAEAAPVEEFARVFGQLANERLPDTKWSKQQAREALAAYVAIEGLGTNAGAAALNIASRASAAVEVLEPQELTAALARLAASRSSDHQPSQVGSILKPPSGAFEAAAADVSVALQKCLLNKGETLKELSAQDLCNAIVGLARSPLLVPDAAAVIAGVAQSRVSELSFPSLLDFSRAVAELAEALQGPQRQQVIECLRETFPTLASAAQSNLQSDFQQVGLCLSGLARIAGSLPEEASEVFSKEVISRNKDQIFSAICQDDEMQLLEVAAPLLRLDSESWSGLLQYMALEGLPKLPASHESNSRFVSILEWIASKEGHLSFPPFFDFAFQELSQRVLSGTAIRKATSLLAKVHLERPDLLALCATAITNAAANDAQSEPAEFADVALDLSAMAGLYSRVKLLKEQRNSNEPHQSNRSNHEKEQRVALEHMAQRFQVSGQIAQDLLTPQNSASDAAFLALSAFAQATCRNTNRTDSADQADTRTVQAGLNYLDVLCTQLKSQTKLSMQQAHIFVTCMRGFCVKGPAPSPPPPSTIEVLEGVIQQCRDFADQKEARLCLAVLQELHSDPACPPILKSLLGADGDPTTDATTGARERLRASMASESAPTPSPNRGLLRRLFGLWRAKNSCRNKMKQVFEQVQLYSLMFCILLPIDSQY